MNTPKEETPKSTQKDWEQEYARDIGMCCSGCDCGHCDNRREIVSKICHKAKEEVLKQIMEKETLVSCGVIDCMIDSYGVFTEDIKEVAGDLGINLTKENNE